MSRATPNRAPRTVAVTSKARFCEQTATFLSLGGLPLLFSAPVQDTKRNQQTRTTIETTIKTNIKEIY